MDNQEKARLRELHRPRTELRRDIESAVQGVAQVGYPLSVWSGRGDWLTITSQASRDKSGPEALAVLDTALARLQSVREKLADLLADEGTLDQVDVQPTEPATSTQAPAITTDQVVAAAEASVTAEEWNALGLLGRMELYSSTRHRLEAAARVAAAEAGEVPPC